MGRSASRPSTMMPKGVGLISTLCSTGQPHGPIQPATTMPEQYRVGTVVAQTGQLLALLQTESALSRAMKSTVPPSSYLCFAEPRNECLPACQAYQLLCARTRGIGAKTFDTHRRPDAKTIGAVRATLSARITSREHGSRSSMLKAAVTACLIRLHKRTTKL